MKESDQEQTKTDIYAAASSQKAASEVGATVSDNYINSSKTVAWSKAEIALAEAYDNGSTESVAESDAKTAVEDYYSVQEMNQIKQWNATISAADTAENTSDMENISDDYVSIRYSYDSQTYTAENWSVVTRSVTLANGTSADVKAVKTTDTQTTSDIVIGPNGPIVHDGDVQTESWSTSADTTNHVVWGIRVSPPDSSYDKLKFVEFADYEKSWDRINQSNADLKNELGPFATSTYDAYQNGEIESQDVLSKNTRMMEYGTDGRASNASMYDSVAALSAMGVDTPNLNGTGMMTVSHNGQETTGMLMAHNAPDDQWRVGKTYNASNISGPVYVASSDGKEVALNGEFEIVSMTNTDGEQIASVDTTQYDYQIADTSEYTSLLDEMAELRQEIEEREPDTTTGGSSGGLLDDLINEYGKSAVVGFAIVGLVGILVLKQLLDLYTP
ncbi:hypothetical protein [Halogranum amylolyticum]|nr:hypothetical protein [Halogranum amylolyticum]